MGIIALTLAASIPQTVGWPGGDDDRPRGHPENPRLRLLLSASRHLAGRIRRIRLSDAGAGAER
jgi:hypothetical protein